MNPDAYDEGRRVLAEAAAAIILASERLHPDTWNRAVSLLLNTPGRIVVTGMGKSGLVGRKIAATLSSVGSPALFLHPAEAVHGDLGAVTGQDVVLALSQSGETGELLALLPAFAALPVAVVALTGRPHSTLARASAAVLDTSIEREACTLQTAPTTSTSVMLAMGDALAVAVMGLRQFTESDYARLHPAGTLGRKLTLRVSDIMRTGTALALVSRRASVLDALLAITKAHAGAAVVTDDAGALAGLLTDGDVRRHLLTDNGLLSRPVSSALNPAPGTLSPDMLAADAVQCLRAFHPDPEGVVGEAPVVDEHGRPLGILMLKDLAAAGLA